MSWTRKRPVGLDYHDPSLAYPGYTLFSSVRGCHATLVDMEGRICHRWYRDEGIQYACLLPNGNLLAHTSPPVDAGGVETIGGSAAALLELDWNSSIVWEYRDPMLHHDFKRLPNGNTLLLSFGKLPEELSSQVKGGHFYEEDPFPMWGDVAQEITPGGEVIYEWRSWEHLSVEDDVICPLESRKEWTHTNSISLTPQGDLLLSFRLISVVGIIDRATGGFKWRWGPGVLSHQHHATYLDTNRILLFDNGCHRLRGPSFSQVLEVDPLTGEITWSYKADPVVAFFSFAVSGAERLPNGNTLICEGVHGRIFEITKDGETVWEYISPFFYASRFGTTPSVFRAHRYETDYPALVGKDLSPDSYEELNRLIATGLYSGYDDGTSGLKENS